MLDNLKLSTPWVTFAHKITALFAEDPDISVIYDNNEKEVKLFVDNSAKADALNTLLPGKKEFGNVTLKITVIPSNEDDSFAALFRTAFAGNPIIDRIETVPFTENAPIDYVIFARKIVSFFNDDLSDFFGAESTLYEDLARDVFGDIADGVYFCTNIEDSKKEGLEYPLGE